jgi:hypothetical protein
LCDAIAHGACANDADGLNAHAQSLNLKKGEKSILAVVGAKWLTTIGR